MLSIGDRLTDEELEDILQSIDLDVDYEGNIKYEGKVKGQVRGSKVKGHSSTSKTENRPHIISEKDSERTIMYHAIYIPASNKNKNEVLEYTLLLVDKMIDQ